MVISIQWQDVSGFKRFDNQIKSLGEDGVKIMQRSLSRAGDQAKTKIIRVLARQTGLPVKVMKRAVKVKRPTFKDLTYVMTTSGGDVSMKYFKPRETQKGVSAAPFGKRQTFPSTFMKAGWFPDRVDMTYRRTNILTKKETGGWNGHVFERDGSSKTPIYRVNTGVFIPLEMLKGETRATFIHTVTEVLPRRVEHELGRLLR